MRKFIYYFMVFPIYISLVYDSIVDFNVLVIISIVYIAIVNIILASRKSYDKLSTIIFFLNNVIIFPFTLIKFNPSLISTYLIVGFLVLCTLHFSVIFFTINRDFIVFLLIISTLNTAPLDLYISVDRLVDTKYFYIGLLNYLWFTCSNSSKVIKLNPKKKSKKTLET